MPTAPASPNVDWHAETMRYDRPHPRLVTMARLVRAVPRPCLLDVGCSTGTLRRLLPADCEYYGCDVTDHARALLGNDRFAQLDFNRSSDLSAFAGRGINVVHVSGVLEYLKHPADLLASAREIVPSGSRLIASIINFQAAAHARRETHHPGWIYKPRLDDLRQSLADSGWRPDRQIAFLGRRAWREWLFRCRAAWHGIDRPWTRRHARQFILLARAA
jgi:SAM-dependent methyltransferase